MGACTRGNTGHGACAPPELYGLTRQDMNGKRGLATDFHPVGGVNDRTKDRYTIKLDSGEVFNLL